MRSASGRYAPRRHNANTGSRGVCTPSTHAAHTSPRRFRSWTSTSCHRRSACNTSDGVTPSSSTSLRTRASSGRDPVRVQSPDATSPCADAGCVEAITTVQPATESLSNFVGGFVAAEGCFTGDGNRRFRFNVGLGASDGGMCELLRSVFGVGCLTRSPRRKPHYDDEVQFTVQATRDLVEVVVPFMDAHLPPSYKREQYLEWRARLLDYWEHRFRRRKRCIFEDCDAPARAHGLCRRHLWQVRRQ